MRTWKGWDFCREPEHTISEEAWNGGDGRIDFNYLQQRPAEYRMPDQPEIDTDPWDITDGGYTESGGS